MMLFIVWNPDIEEPDDGVYIKQPTPEGAAEDYAENYCEEWETESIDVLVVDAACRPELAERYEVTFSTEVCYYANKKKES